MNAKLSTNRKFHRILASLLSIFAILAIALPATQVAYAVSSSPFLGHWQATDVDGSDIRLSISGPPTGPFQITWTESYVSFCNREAGIVRGTGQLNESDPNLLEADLHLTCFTTGATLDFHIVWRYHPMTGTLSSRYNDGSVTIWYRPGQPQPLPPELGLRVNYGHDWVESFYEGGHMAWVTVTESDGVTVKATAEVVTEPKDFWGGETGFQTRAEDWTPAQPDIQPNDWVFGWVDNGATAQVQIGDISGTIDLANDAIGGTILAPWFTDPVQVECLDWGSGQEPPYSNKDGGSVLANGEQAYSCTWTGEWNIQPGQPVGVGYFGPDGNWVSNVFVVTNPTFVAYIPGAIEGYDWPMGSTIAITVNDGEYIAQAVSEQRPESPEGTTRVLFELWKDNFSIGAGDRILMTDGVVTKEVVVTDLAVTDINLGARTVSGTYDPAADLWVWLYGQDGQVPETTDPDNGTWTASFAELTPGAWGGAVQHDGDGDGTSLDFRTPDPGMYAVPDEERIYASEWTPGANLAVSVNGAEVATQLVPDSDSLYGPEVLFDLNGVLDLQAGDRITLSDGRYSKELIVHRLQVTGFDLGSHTISGVADPGSLLIGVNGEDVQITVGEDGSWAASSPGWEAGEWGSAIKTDDDGDQTRDIFMIPRPMMYAFPEENWLDGVVWTEGQPLTLQVYQAGTGQKVYEKTETVPPPSEVPWTVVHFDLGEAGYDLKPGDRLVMSQGGYERELIISSLQITRFDLGSQTISGVGDAGADFLVRINGQDVPGTIAGDGSWSVHHELLQPGVWGEAIQPDADGDETRDAFQAPLE